MKEESNFEWASHFPTKLRLLWGFCEAPLMGSCGVMGRSEEDRLSRGCGPSIYSLTDVLSALSIGCPARIIEQRNLQLVNI